MRYQSGTLPTSKGYTGQRADTSTSGLDYYGARYYDPVAGQFTSADTLLAGGLNRYGYVAGNPESRADPSGHIYTCPTGTCGPTGGEPGNPTDPTNPTNPTPTPTPVPPPTPTTVSDGSSGTGGSGGSSSGSGVSAPRWLEVFAALLVSVGRGATLAQLPYLLAHWNNAVRLSYLRDVLVTLLEHNHSAKNPGRFLRRSGDLADAEGGADALSKIGEALTAVGFFADWGAYTLSFLFGDTRPDLKGSVRGAVAVVAGFLHATLLVGISLFGASLADALVTTMFPVAGAVFAPFAAAAGGFVFGLIGGNIADKAVPIIINDLVPYGGGSNFAVA